MTFLVLFVLAVVWAVYLVSWVRGRTSHRRVNSISSFSNHLSILERTTPATPAVPVAARTAPLQGGQYFAPRRPTLSPQKKRRRDILLGTAGAVVVTLLLGLLMGGFAWVLFLLSLAAFGGYVYLLASVQKQKLERQAKVRTLRSVTPQPDAVDGFDDTDDAPVRHMYVVGGN